MLNSSRMRHRRIEALRLSQGERRDGQRAADAPDVTFDEAEGVTFAEAPPLEFARDCGADGGVSVRVEADRDDCRDVAVPSGLVLVGRGPQCTLKLSGADVAEKHFLALYLQGQFFVCDLGSPSGTFHNDQKVTSGWVPNGSALHVGDARIVLEGPASEPKPSEPRDVTAADDDAGLWLRFPFADHADQRHQIKRAVTLFGRDARCRVRIPSRSVSRFHCVLVRTAGGAWVHDLGSREGIRVNGRRVEMARIDDDCELTVGRTSVYLHHGHEFAADQGPDSGMIAPGMLTEDFVAALIGEMRAAQRETLTEIGGMLRDVLRALAKGQGASPQPGVETAIKTIERRMKRLRLEDGRNSTSLQRRGG